MRAVVGWKSVFYQITKHGAEVKLPRQFVQCPTNSQISLQLFFFLFIKSKLFEQAGRQVATEELNKSL